MSPLAAAVLGVYFAALVLLAFFGAHRYVMAFLYLRHRHRRALPAALLDRLPPVTVQLPIYNEMYVVDRLLDSVCALRYPRELLEIQVLDDSTDETTAVAEAAVARARDRGFDIRLLHRETRPGFKAGALEAGLRRARGELVLILDADFVAAPDLLEKTVGHFADPRVGMVQVRWGHLNRDYSLLTEIQAILIDGHFTVEQGGRNRAGLFFNFNGTAGVWRRAAIESAGGWQHDTLTEDLDLSYRAQAAGWRFVFVQDVVCPAELPVEMNAFKNQQHRWAKGSIQTARKLLPRLLRAPLPLPVKLEAVVHLTGYSVGPLLILASLLMFPALVVRQQLGWQGSLLVDLPLWIGGTLSVCGFYLLGQREIFGGGWTRRLRYLPLLLAAGIGLSVTTGRAVVEALLGRPSPFHRTPKHGITTRGDDWRGRRYRGRTSWAPAAEIALGVYCSAMAAYALANGMFATLPFIVLFQGGFFYTGLASLRQGGSPPPRAA